MFQSYLYTSKLRAGGDLIHSCDFSWHLFIVDTQNYPFTKSLVSYHFYMSEKQLSLNIEERLLIPPPPPTCLFIPSSWFCVISLCMSQILCSVMICSVPQFQGYDGRQRCIQCIELLILIIELMNMRCFFPKKYRISLR